MIDSSIYTIHMKEELFELGVKGLIQNSEGKVLLLKTNATQVVGNIKESYWDIPGGRVHKGGTIHETLEREILEETGLHGVESYTFLATAIHPKVILPIPNGEARLILTVYLCNMKNVSNVQLSSEHVEFDWFTLDQAREKLRSNYPTELVDMIK